MRKTYEVAVRETVVYYVQVDADSENEAKIAAEDAITNSEDPLSDFDSQLVSRTFEVK